MKLVLTLMTTFCAVAIVYSQPINEYFINANRSKQHSIILGILREQWPATNSALKPTGTKQRVVGQTWRGTTFVDSTSYIYSGTKGSRFNYNLFTYNTFLNSSYEPIFIYPHAPNTLDVMADTFYNFDNDVLDYKEYGQYRSDNKLSLILTEYSEDYPFNRNKSVMTYNADGFPDSYYLSMYDDPAPPDTNFITKYTYSNGRVIIDSVWQKEGGVWSFGSFTRHYYNSAGKLASDSTFVIVASTLQLSYVTSLAYYPDGMLKSLISTYYDNNNIIQTQVDSLGYTAGSDYATYWESRRTTSFTGNTTIFKEIKFPGANGLPDSARTNTTTGSSTSGRTYRYLYNTANNPEVLSVFSDGNSSSTPDQTIRFYYETYDDGLSITETVHSIDVSIHPNPFDQYIALTCKVASVGRYKLKLVNTSGIEVFSTTSSLKAGTSTIAIPDLPVGFYTLVLQNGKGETISKKMIRN